jgi:hypothetical protein
MRSLLRFKGLADIGCPFYVEMLVIAAFAQSPNLKPRKNPLLRLPLFMILQLGQRFGEYLRDSLEID